MSTSQLRPRAVRRSVNNGPAGRASRGRGCIRKRIVKFRTSVSVELRSKLAPSLLELAVDPQLNAADCQEADPRFGLAGFDLVADPELPFPDARHCGRRNRVLYAPVIHGKSPPGLTGW